MSQTLTVALDAMGGDRAPDIVIKGLRKARKRYPDARFLLFGDQKKLDKLLKKHKKAQKICEIRHAEDVISDEDKVAVAIRQGRASSMWLAIQAVKRGEADAVVSAGNTGAFMAMAKLVLRTLPGIDRPGFASVMPTINGESVMLDLGANAECNANNLVEFAVMGEVFARILLGVDRPSVGLLNIGSEELKGTDTLREAADILRNAGDAHMNFSGFVEGHHIGQGVVDVVVTDGFTGNVALKTAEGTAKLYTEFLKSGFRSSIFSQLGYLLAKSALAKVRARTDPRRYNGALLLGLNGVAVKSHGGTDGLGFSNAIGVAVDLLRQNLNEAIKAEMARMVASQSPISESGAIQAV